MGATNPYPGDTLERLQAVEREILKVIDDLCQRHGITYFADGGTCLGAVRHKGFIPWDDDIDVAMLHEDFLRFCEVARTELPPGYSIHTFRDTPNVTIFWAKVYKDGTRFMDAEMIEAKNEQPIFIDVMTYRTLDADPGRAFRQREVTLFLQRICYLTRISHPKIHPGVPHRETWLKVCRVAHYPLRLVPRRLLHALFELAWKTNDPGELLVNGSYGRNRPLTRDALVPVVRVPFDDMTVCIPADADTYLRNIYGDSYMSPPPEFDRYRHAPLVLDFGDGVNVMEGLTSATA